MQLADVDLSARLPSRDAADERLRAVQRRLRQAQGVIHHQGHRVVVVLEGWDTAGKGGIIRRLAAKLDPRGLRVHPIGAPRPGEADPHYLRRFWLRLPQPGEIAVFDRSWYGRVLTERVDGLIDEATWCRAYDEINTFERMLTDDGVVVVKLFLHISAHEQRERLRARLQDPDKRWKLAHDDLRNLGQRSAFAAAVDAMLERTHSAHAPWTVIAAEDKPYARVRALETAEAGIAERIDLRAPDVDPALLDKARRALDE